MGNLGHVVETPKQKRERIGKELGLARLHLGEAKFMLSKDDADEVIFLVDHSIEELRSISAQLKEMK